MEESETTVQKALKSLWLIEEMKQQKNTEFMMFIEQSHSKLRKNSSKPPHPHFILSISNKANKSYSCWNFLSTKKKKKKLKQQTTQLNRTLQKKLNSSSRKRLDRLREEKKAT